MGDSDDLGWLWSSWRARAASSSFEYMSNSTRRANGVSRDRSRKSLPTGPAYDSGDDVGPLSQKPSGTVEMATLFCFSLHSFAYRQRAWTSNLDEIGALIRDEAEEIEDERDDRDEVSETIDSGDDIDETELANDDRR